VTKRIDYGADTPRGWAMARLPLTERVRLGSTPEPNTGCWLWDRYVDPTGYAMAGFNGKTRRVARVSYEAFKGPIQPGLTIDHLCRQRSCVNPDHLEAVTMQVNVLRAPCAPTAVNARKTGCPCGRPYTLRCDGARTCRPCASRRARHYYHRDKAALGIPSHVRRFKGQRGAGRIA